MKRSRSLESLPTGKMAKHVHHPSDKEQGARFVRVQWTTSPSDHLACDPLPARTEPDSKLYLDEAWKMLKPAISIIFKDEYTSAPLDWNSISHSVMRASMTDSGNIIFHRIKDECEPHISAALGSLHNHIGVSDVDFLPLVEKCWLDFKRRMMFVSDLAMYKTCNGLTLLDMGKGLFHNNLSLASQIQSKVIAGILGLIADERLGKSSAINASLSLLKNLMDMFRGVLHLFEKPFLDSATHFYFTKANQVLEQSGLSQYLIYVEGILLQEDINCLKNSYYLCCRPLKEALRKQLLNTRLEEGFKVLMDKVCIDDLRRMYRLFYQAGFVGYMDSFLKSYILEKGEREGSLQELHTCVYEIWHRCFEHDIFLEESIEQCFERLGLHVPDELIVVNDVD